MDGKTNADTINQAANGGIVECPYCNAKVESNNKFCPICGFDIAGYFANRDGKADSGDTQQLSEAPQETESETVLADTEVITAQADSEELKTLDDTVKFEPLPPIGSDAEAFAPVSSDSQDGSGSQAAFAPVPVVEATGDTEEKKPESNVHREEYVEPVSAFALGLPSWNVEPPQIAVRRIK